MFQRILGDSNCPCEEGRLEAEVDTADHQLDVPTADYRTEKMALSAQISGDVLENCHLTIEIRKPLNVWLCGQSPNVPPRLEHPKNPLCAGMMGFHTPCNRKTV